MQHRIAPDAQVSKTASARVTSWAIKQMEIVYKLIYVPGEQKSVILYLNRVTAVLNPKRLFCLFFLINQIITRAIRVVGNSP